MKSLLGDDSDGGPAVSRQLRLIRILMRVPAAFCRVIGFRSRYGVFFTPELYLFFFFFSSLDTVGLFAKDPNILH